VLIYALVFALNEQHRMKQVCFVLITLYICSCTVVPRVDFADPDNDRCKLTTRKRTLEVSGGEYAGCLVVSQDSVDACWVPLLYTSATALVSGSIVLVGNTVHWLEKQGKCDDGLLHDFIQSHNEPLLEQNGQVMDGQSSQSPE